MRIDELDQAIKQVCPIDGISSDGRIDFTDDATAEQRAAAQSLMDVNLPTLETNVSGPDLASILKEALVAKGIFMPGDLEVAEAALNSAKVKTP